MTSSSTEGAALPPQVRTALSLDGLELRPSDAENLAEKCHTCAGAKIVDDPVLVEQHERQELQPDDEGYLPREGCWMPCPDCIGPNGPTGLVHGESPRDHLSHSSIGILNACPQKFDYHYTQRLELVQTRRSLGMGRAFHHAIEVGEPLAGAAALEEEFAATPGMDPDKLAVEQSTVVGAAKAYLDKFPHDDDQGDEVMREVEYRVRLRSPWTGRPSQTFDLLGIADGVVHRGSHLKLIERKFVGRVDAPTVHRLPLDRQVTLGCYGLWRATGLFVREVDYRFVKKPSIRQKQGESLRQFCDRIEADYAERPDFYIPDIDPLFRTADDMLRVEAELWVWAEQVRQHRQQAIPPRNTSSCSDYGGCQFIPLCVGDPDAPTLFRERPKRDVDAEAVKK